MKKEEVPTLNHKRFYDIGKMTKWKDMEQCYMKMDIHLKDIIEIIKEKDQGDILIMMVE